MMRDADAPLRLAIATADRDLADRLAALLAGIDGLVLAAPGETADALLTDPPDGAGEAVGRHLAGPADLITAREAEVLALLAEGASNKAIARRLGISVHTAKFHVASLLDKLDATGRTDAVAHAARIGLLDL